MILGLENIFLFRRDCSHLLLYNVANEPLFAADISHFRLCIWDYLIHYKAFARCFVLFEEWTVYGAAKVQPEPSLPPLFFAQCVGFVRTLYGCYLNGVGLCQSKILHEDLWPERVSWQGIFYAESQPLWSGGRWKEAIVTWSVPLALMEAIGRIGHAISSMTMLSLLKDFALTHCNWMFYNNLC